jgi:hypothetical protein
VILGQSDVVFAHAGHDVSSSAWKSTKALARARKCVYNSTDSMLGLFIASLSDIEDVVTILTALYIEIGKLHEKTRVGGQAIRECFSAEDFIKLQTALGEQWEAFENIVAEPIDYEITVLNGSYLEFARAAQEWWINIAASRKKYPFNVYKQPVYFVSSNSHSLLNVLSGFPVREQAYLQKKHADRLAKEQAEFKKERVPLEHQCYYLSRFSQKSDPQYAKRREAWHKRFGLVTFPAFHHIDIDAQIFSIHDVMKNEHSDKRLGLTTAMREKLLKSNALILNIAYPLGLGAYTILKEVSENVSEMRGIYIMGKAAALNASVGDVMIPNFVHDTHTGNNVFIENAVSAQKIAPFVPKNSLFSAQKAITVRGTFLQNEESLADMYKQGYGIIEMEAGPYLERVYEMLYPTRYPTKETLVIKPNFRLGMAYYVSDTPYDKGTNLGAKHLTWEGLNATYGISIAFLQDIFSQELNRLA